MVDTPDLSRAGSDKPMKTLLDRVQAILSAAVTVKQIISGTGCGCGSDSGLGIFVRRKGEGKGEGEGNLTGNGNGNGHVQDGGHGAAAERGGGGGAIHPSEALALAAGTSISSPLTMAPGPAAPAPPSSAASAKGYFDRFDALPGVESSAEADAATCASQSPGSSSSLARGPAAAAHTPASAPASALTLAGGARGAAAEAGVLRGQLLALLEALDVLATASRSTAQAMATAARTQMDSRRQQNLRLNRTGRGVASSWGVEHSKTAEFYAQELRVLCLGRTQTESSGSIPFPASDGMGNGMASGTPPAHSSSSYSSPPVPTGAGAGAGVAIGTEAQAASRRANGDGTVDAAACNGPKRTDTAHVCGNDVPAIHAGDTPAAILSTSTSGNGNGMAASHLHRRFQDAISSMIRFELKCLLNTCECATRVPHGAGGWMDEDGEGEGDDDGEGRGGTDDTSSSHCDGHRHHADQTNGGDDEEDVEDDENVMHDEAEEDGHGRGGHASADLDTASMSVETCSHLSVIDGTGNMRFNCEDPAALVMHALLKMHKMQPLAKILSPSPSPSFMTPHRTSASPKSWLRKR